MPDTARRDPVLTGPFLLSFAANLLQGLAFNLYLHLPGFLQQLGAGEIQIGVIFGVTAATAIAAKPAIGRVMDREGRRAVIVAGGCLNVAVCGLYLTISQVGPWLYLVRIGHGIAEAMLFAALFTHAADLLPFARRTEGIALFGVSGMLPMSLSGLLGDAILARADYAAVFLTSLVFAAGSLLLSLPLQDHWPGREGQPARGLRAAALQPDLLPLWFMGGVFATALAAQFTFLKTFIVETQVGSMGLFFTAYSGAAVVLRLLLAWLPERVGPKRVLFPALALLALGYVLLARAAGPTAVAVAGLLGGVGHGFTFPILSGFVVQRARPTERGAALSIFTALFDGGVLIGGPTLGAVIHFAGYPAMFGTAAAIVIAGAAVFALWDRGR